MTTRRGTVLGVFLRAVGLIVIAGALAFGDSLIRPVKTSVQGPPSAGGSTTGGPSKGPGLGKPPDPAPPAHTPPTPGDPPTDTTKPVTDTPPVAPADPAQSGNAAEVALPAGPKVSVAEAKALWDATTPFFDARTAEEYQAGHISEAIHLTAEDVQEGRSADKLQYCDPEKPIVIYCGGGSCHASENLAILLSNFAGFKKVYIMEAGYQAWKDAGHPVLP